MLNQKELQSVLFYIHPCCKLITSPVQVNLNDLTVSWRLPIWKKCLTRISYGAYLLHALYTAGSLAYVLGFERDSTTLHQLIMHWAIASAGTAASFWYCVIYVANPDVHSALVEITFKSTESNKGNGGGTKGARRLLEYSFQDLIALFMPCWS